MTNPTKKISEKEQKNLESHCKRLRAEINAMPIPDDKEVKTERLIYYPLDRYKYNFSYNNSREDIVHRIWFYSQAIKMQGDLKLSVDKKSYLITKISEMRYYTEGYWRGNGVPSIEQVFVGDEKTVDIHCEELAREDRNKSIREEILKEKTDDLLCKLRVGK